MGFHWAQLATTPALLRAMQEPPHSQPPSLLKVNSNLFVTFFTFLFLFSTVPANIAVAPNDTSVYVGDSVSLSCVSYGLPLPTISWTRAGQPLSLHSQLMINETEIMTDHVTFVRSTLILCSLQLTDAGQYTCSTSNNHSTSQETFTISVKSKKYTNGRFFSRTFHSIFHFPQLNHRL